MRARYRTKKLPLCAQRIVEGVLKQVLGKRPVPHHCNEIAADFLRMRSEQRLHARRRGGRFRHGSLSDGAHNAKMPQQDET